MDTFFSEVDKTNDDMRDEYTPIRRVLENFDNVLSLPIHVILSNNQDTVIIAVNNMECDSQNAYYHLLCDVYLQILMHIGINEWEGLKSIVVTFCNSLTNTEYVSNEVGGMLRRDDDVPMDDLAVVLVIISLTWKEHKTDLFKYMTE